MPKTLKAFSVRPAGENYQLRMEDSEGMIFECTASFDQLDTVAEDIDRQLDADQDPSH
jgi:hypothetical protein